MGQGRFERLAPLTGFVFFLIILGLLLLSGDTPDTDDPAAEVLSFWRENDTEQMVVAAIGALSGVFLLWFGASLRSALSEAEGGSGRLAALAFAGAILATSGLLILFGLNFAVAESADDSPASVVQALSALNNSMFFPFIGGFGVFALASGLGILRTRALPAVAGWIALALGVLSFTPVGWIAFLAMVIWVAVASVMLYRRGVRDIGAPAASPGSPS